MNLATDKNFMDGQPRPLRAPVNLVDPHTGLSEEIGYFEGEPNPLYGVLHAAKGSSSTGVVIAQIGRASCRERV